MYFSKIAAIAAAVNIASAIPADIDNLISGRQATCNSDNCLRALRSNPRSALSYCASYLSTAQKVVTVIAPTPATSYVAADPATTTVATALTTTTISGVCTTTTTQTQLYKRATQSYEAIVTAACPALAKPAQSPAANRISSACSCALSSIGPSTTTTTQTTTVTNPPAQVTSTSTMTESVCTSTVTVTATTSAAAKCSQISNPYAAPNTKQFNLDCGAFYNTTPSFQVPASLTLIQCMDYCSTQADCVAIVGVQNVVCFTFNSAQLAEAKMIGAGQNAGLDRATLIGF